MKLKFVSNYRIIIKADRVQSFSGCLDVQNNVCCCTACCKRKGGTVFL